MNSYFTAFLVMSFVLVAYLLGGTSYATLPTDKYCAQYNVAKACYASNGTGEFNIWDKMLQYTQSWNFGFALIGLAAVATLSILGGLNLLAIIPFAIAFVLLDFLVLPVNIVQNFHFPYPLDMIIQLFFYVLIFLTMLGFVRTGQ